MGKDDSDGSATVMGAPSSMSLPQSTLSFRTALAAGVIVHLAAALAGYVMHGPTPLFDATTIWLVLMLALLLVGAVLLAGRNSFPLVAVFVFTVLIFMLARIQLYLWAPALVEFPFGDTVTSDEVNAGLWNLLTGTISILIGIATASAFWRRRKRVVSEVPAPRSYSVPAILLVFSVILAIEIYITVVMGVGVFGKLRAESGNTAIQLLKGLLSIDMAFFMALVALLLGRKTRRYAWAAMAGVTGIYIAYLTYQGSRVGGLRVLTMLFMYALARRGNFRVSSTYAIILVVLAMLTVVTFPLATYTRNRLVLGRVEELARYDTEDLGLYFRPSRFAAVVLNRLGTLDYLVLVISENGDPVEKAHYLNLNYAGKSIINAIAPGAPFPDAELSTSRAHNVIYRGIKTSHLSGVNTEYWTIWGLAYLLLGPWGGAIALLAAGFVFQTAFLLLRRPGTYGQYLTPWFLFMTHLYYVSMGLDHSVTLTVFTLLQVLVTLTGFRFAEQLWRKTRRLSSAPFAMQVRRGAMKSGVGT